MIRYGGLGIVVLSGMLIGCQAKTPPPPQTPALGYDEIRSELIGANPGAAVGQVGGTYLQYHLVLINGVDPGQLQLGDAVSFLDDRLNNLTIGSVTKIMQDGNIIVRIQPSPTGARQPEVGDVAVHIPAGQTLNTNMPANHVSPGPTVPGPTTMPAVPPDMTNPAPPTPPAPATPPATEPAATTPPAPPTPPAQPPATQPEMNK